MKRKALAVNSGSQSLSPINAAAQGRGRGRGPGQGLRGAPAGHHRAAPGAAEGRQGDRLPAATAGAFHPAPQRERQGEPAGGEDGEGADATRRDENQPKAVKIATNMQKPLRCCHGKAAR